MLKSIRFMLIKSTNVKPVIRRFHCLKAGQLPLFDPTNNIAKNFLSWLTGIAGGCRSDRQAQQLVRKRLKFFKFCCEDEDELTFDIVDNYSKEGFEQYGSGSIESDSKQS